MWLYKSKKLLLCQGLCVELLNSNLGKEILVCEIKMARKWNS